MIRALARAHESASSLRMGESLIDIAEKTRHSDSDVRTRVQLAFLYPDIQRAILEGRKPIPLDWDTQARIYGFRTFQSTS